ncbi:MULTISPECIES: Na+/H+ antiporter subunit C [unclassified Roseitalea]|uniref:Na+/H+ antiporter subunit C n=1 Tax=unclassified Roseitalea TaxID=2639107 RepID=UPI00273FC423|nr:MULTISPECIES: Na+/H+ antiporter subunit C [unclassified Roseitalea]
METAMAFLGGLYFAVSIYLMLSQYIIRILLGAALFSNGVNLTLFTMGRITRETPPLIPPDAYVGTPDIANGLPQALVLTAIVIAFSLFAFLLVLVMRSYQELGTDDTEEMRRAEPRDEPVPPLGY